MSDRVSNAHRLNTQRFSQSEQEKSEQDFRCKQNDKSEASTKTQKENNTVFLYTVVVILLFEFVAVIGSVVYSITASQRSESGVMQFQFPWLGFLITAAMIPVVVLLILHLITFVLHRDEESKRIDEAKLGTRATYFFTLVRSAPTIIILASLLLLGAALYYVKDVMEVASKIADSFGDIAIWCIGAFVFAFCIKGITQAIYQYKMKKMEAEYAFRRDVLERTGAIILDTRYQSSAKQIESASENNIPECNSVKALEENPNTIDTNKDNAS